MSDVRNFARLVRRHLGEAGMIFEFGARDCGESLAISKEFPEARIYSFECNRATLPVCRERVSRHPAITLVECAVGETDGIATFHPIDPARTVTTWSDGNPGASSLFVASGKYELETYIQGTEQVPITRPDTFMAQHGIGRVDALWMDIQGAELMALKGFGELLQRVGLISLEAEFVEIYKDQPLFADVHAFLRKRGFLLVGFLSLGKHSCDAVYVRIDLAGWGGGVRSAGWHCLAMLKVGIYYPIRSSGGRLLRRLGILAMPTMR